MLRAAVVGVALATLSCGSSPPPKPTPVAPAEPAPVAPVARVPEMPQPSLRLPTTLQARAYRAHLALDPARLDFHGEIELDATLTEISSILWLNAEGLKVASAEVVTADGRVVLVPSEPKDGLLALRPTRDLEPGALTIRIAYEGPVTATDSHGAFVQTVDGDPYVFTQFEPIDARRVFPCIDEPSSKVPWTVTLDVPAALTALSNAPVARESDLGDGVRRVEFGPTKPLPSYLIAFAVGPFELVDAGKTPSGAPIRIAALRGHADRARYAADTTATLVGVLEDYFGSPYPYAKLDLVPIPTTVGFSAMENAGMITFSEGLLTPQELTPSRKRSFDSVAAHELAHQWFGDLVTLAWWDDIWLNEAFATWAEEKVMLRRPDWTDGDEVHDALGGLEADGLATARRVREPIDTIDDIHNTLDGGITYAKGAGVIRMFEQWVGADVFRTGVQQYLKRHAYGTADYREFLAAIDEVSPRDVTAAFTTFLDQSGAPRISASLECSKDAPAKVTLRQERWLLKGASASPGEAPRWQVPVCIAAGDRRTRATTCTLLTEPQAELTLDGPRCPTWILPNAGGLGYYRSSLEPAAFAALMKHGWKQLTTGERIVAVSDGGAMTRRGELEYGVMVDRLAQIRDGGPSLYTTALWMAGALTGAISDENVPAARRWVRSMFGAQARKLGFIPAPDESAEKRDQRRTLLDLVAGDGRDPVLLAEARKHARKWRELPDGVRGQILGYAVVSDPAFGRALLAELDAIQDRRMHRDVLHALTNTEDPELVDLLLQRAIDPKTDIVQDQWITLLLSHRPNEARVEKFVREHLSEVAARMTAGARAYLASVVTSDCDVAQRDADVAWINEHIRGFEGGELAAAQTIEELDQCIARRRELRPQADAWLKKHKR